MPPCALFHPEVQSAILLPLQLGLEFRSKPVQTQASRLFEGNPQVLPPNRDGAQNAPTLCLEQLAQKKWDVCYKWGFVVGLFRWFWKEFEANRSVRGRTAPL